MEDFRVDVGGRQGARGDRHPAGDRAVHAGRRDHPGRPAARAAAGPVRLHRPPGLLRGRTSSSVIVRRSAGLLGVTLRDDGAKEIASRSRGTPRIANRLLRRVRDFAEVRGRRRGHPAIARAALELYEVDEHGPGPAGPGGARPRWSAGSAAGRSGCPRWPSRSARSARRSRWSPSRSWSGQGLIARTPRGRVATPAAPGSTWACPPAARRPGRPRAAPAAACSVGAELLNQAGSRGHAGAAARVCRDDVTIGPMRP